jgi:hypothetical protein
MSEPAAIVPTTKAGKALLEREAYNSRSFTLITPEAIVAIEREAARDAVARLVEADSAAPAEPVMSVAMSDADEGPA